MEIDPRRSMDRTPGDLRRAAAASRKAEAPPCHVADIVAGVDFGMTSAAVRSGAAPVEILARVDSGMVSVTVAAADEPKETDLPV